MPRLFRAAVYILFALFLSAGSADRAGVSIFRVFIALGYMIFIYAVMTGAAKGLAARPFFAWSNIPQERRALAITLPAMTACFRTLLVSTLVAGLINHFSARWIMLTLVLLGIVFCESILAIGVTLINRRKQITFFTFVYAPALAASAGLLFITTRMLALNYPDFLPGTFLFGQIAFFLATCCGFKLHPPERQVAA